MKLIIKIVIGILFFTSMIFAQDDVLLDSSKIETDKNIIFVNYKIYGDSVVIRWAPNSSSAWIISNKSGYMIDRIIEDNLSGEEKYIPVQDKPFMPLSLEEMIKRFENTNNDFAKVATEMLYGDPGTLFEAGSMGHINTLSEEQNLRFAYSLLAADFNIDAAYALGLRWSFRPNKYPPDNEDSTYKFRIRSLADTNKVQIQEAYFIVELTDYDNVLPPPLNSYTEGTDSTIKIYWNKAPSYSGYNIERSTDGKNFTRLNDKPYFYSEPEKEKEQVYYADEIIGNKDSVTKMRRQDIPEYKYNLYTDKVPPGKTYYYRVQGIDAFTDVSYYTETVSGQCVIEDKKEYIPENVKIIPVNDSTAIIKWDKPRNTEKLLGYAITFSRSMDSNYQALTDSLIPINTNMYEIKGVPAGYLFYYIVASIDDRDRLFRGFPVPYILKDSIPPAKPVGVKAYIDTSGVVFISWDENKEIDIDKYNIYFGSQADGEFIKISNYPFDENYFYDQISLHTLTRSYFYKVEAIDYAGNISELSDPAEAIIPDTIPPVSPLISQYYVGNGYVKLDFVLSSSIDIKEHRFCRRINKGEWEVLKTLPINANNKHKIILFDSSIVAGQDYEYSMIAEDLAGLKSDYANPICVSFNKEKSSLAKKNVNLKGDFDSKSNSITLIWSSEALVPKSEHYVLYKNENNSGWEMYKSFDDKTNKFNYLKVEKGKNYKFKVYVFQEGSQVGECNEINIDI